VKTPVLAVIVVIAGLAAGGGAAFGTSLVLGNKAAPGAKAGAADHGAEAELPVFVPTGKMLAPLVFSDGRLAGYVSFRAQLEIAPDKAEFVTARLPLLLHAVNMRTYKTPMASGPDGMLPDLTAFRTLLTSASDEAFGKGVVKRAAIVEAAPA
jgi:hypothetical protein